jgi:tetratricopeptide (TPR) repeat protein
VFSPRIVLPRASSAWPEAKLRAVLAHEAAHIRRRDAIVSFAAHLNRCLFWFHPLSWWLERQLAIAAEHACDEAAVRATGQAREYAQVLVEVAETVLLTGGRFAWQGVGMDGAGSLEHRIARILRGDLARAVSRPRKAAVALACATAIFLVAACQPSRDTLVAKAEARQRQEKQRSVRVTAHWKSVRGSYSAALAMTADQAAALETALTRNPDDFESRKKLLDYYGLFPNLHGSATAKPDLPSIFAACRRHVLWMIERHPEYPGASNAFYFAFAPGDKPVSANYERAKTLWLAQADRDGQPAAVYINAAAFFQYADLPLSEKMLLRAQAADPKGDALQGMYMDSWSSRMGSFYGTVYTMYSLAPGTQVSDWIQSHTSEEAQTFYLAEVTRKLQQSTDATLLLSAANVLVAMHLPSEPGRHPGVNPFVVGKAALERAMRLDPKSTWARQILNEVRDRELTVTLPKAVVEGTLDSRRQAIEALPEGDRFRELSILAIYAAADAVRPDHFTSAAWQQAAQYAKEALDLAPKVRNHPDYGTAFFRANMVLGMASLSAGDAKTAAAYLLKASDAPATDELRYPMTGERPWPMTWQFPNALTAALLKAGERDAVARFLDRYAKLCVTQHESALEDAALIRAGKTPAWAGI